jgi:hypothetical protein
MRLVKVLVADIPLGSGSGLEVQRDQFDGLPALVAVGGLAYGTEVGFLEWDP